MLRFTAVLLCFLTATSTATGNGEDREEGVFHIRLGGEEVGSERFTLISTGEKVSSASVLQFRNPAETRQRVQMETQLEMNSRFVPLNYQLRSDVDGKKGSILGIFTPGQAMFEYSGTGSPRKAGVLVGKEYTLLDSNIFHHFIFLARLFDFESRDKVQKFEVVIPQETDSGILSVKVGGKENLKVRGKNVEARRLDVDSGAFVMQLWVDRRHTLVRIAVPSKRIEVERD